MAQRGMETVPAPIQDELSELSDSEEVHCRLCHKVFASPVALRNHVRIHHIETYETGDPTVWTKSKDDPIVKTRSGRSKKGQRLALHKRKQQILLSMAPNNLDCNNVTSDNSILKKQTRKKRKEVKRPKEPQNVTGPFECLESFPIGVDGRCHQIFFSCCSYSLHVLTEHGNRHRTHRCQVCERPVAAPDGDPRAPYVCETCGKAFETVEGLQEHTNRVHVKRKPYECPICHKRFTQPGGLVVHKRLHTGDRPHPCSFCEKAFTQKSGLDQHLRIHTKVKPYRCIVCSKSFVQSVHLKQHMRTHTNVAPFQCGICDRRFKQSNQLNNHLKSHKSFKMTPEQRDKYNMLVGKAKQDEVVASEMERVEYEIEDMADEEQPITEQTSQKEWDIYIIEVSNDEMQEHFSV